MAVIEQTATELLVEAREFISKPERWCQGFMALDEDHVPVHDATMIYAKRCCGVGAIQLASYRRGIDSHAEALFRAGDLLDRAAIHLYPDSEGQSGLCPAAYVNDELGHAAILAVYDAAIAASSEVTT